MAVPPRVDGRLKSQKNPARRPDEVEVVNPFGPDYLVRQPGEDKPARPRQDPPAEPVERVDPTTGELVAVPPASGSTSTPRARGRKIRITEKRRLVGTQKALLMLRDGMPMVDIADELNVAVSTVVGWLARHRRTVEAASLDAVLDETALPLAVDNLVHGLLAGDKDYTLETLKGRGKFRRHTAGEDVVKHEIPTLVVRYEGAPAIMPVDDPTTLGHVVGAMRLPKAKVEVVDAELVTDASAASGVVAGPVVPRPHD